MIGLSKPNLFTEQIVKNLAKKPIIFALSNPEPEIRPELAHSYRDDIIMATSLSEYPNQLSNLQISPYMLRGALDVRAT